MEGEFYNLYHGFMEARSLTDSTSKMLYTLTLDVSNLADQATKDVDIERRRGMFTNALRAMRNWLRRISVWRVGVVWLDFRGPDRLGIAGPSGRHIDVVVGQWRQPLPPSPRLR